MNKVRLEDACYILNGYAFKSENYVSDGVRIIRIANVQKGYIEDKEPQFYPIDAEEVKKYILYENDLLLSLTGNVGRVALLPASMLPAALNQRVACLRIKEESVISQDFLFHYLNSDIFENDCISSSKGVAQKNMSTGWLKNYEIPVFSQEKQKLISNLFSLIDSLIEKSRIQLQKLDELIKSRFVEMFGDPVADSMNWGQIPLKLFLESIRYGTSTPPEFVNEGYAFIRATNIKNGRIIDKDMKFIPQLEADRLEKCKLNGGEILIVRSGINAGDTGIVTDKYRGQYAGYDMILVLKPSLHPVFLNTLINTTYMEKVVKPLTRRAAQPHLNSKQTQGFPIINVPIDIQNQFADFVTKVEQQKATVQKSIEKLETLKKSLMQEYFG